MLLLCIEGGKPCKDRDTIPEWVMKEGDMMDGYCIETMGNLPKKQKSKDVKGVQVRGGGEATTSGIDFWKQLCVIPDKNNPAKKMCLLLMDTQGLWDASTNDKCNSSIFGLSCVLSSYLIFNQKGTLTSEDLSQLASLTEFSNGLTKLQKDGRKAFQRMDILFRDFTNISSRKTIDEAEQARLKKLEDLNTKPALNKHTTKIKTCFEKFDIMCLNSPGEIDDVDYNGDLNECNKLFLKLLGHYIQRIIGTIRPRNIGGEDITGKDFIEYAKNFADIFEKQDVYPDSTMVMDAASDVSNSKKIDAYCDVFYFVGIDNI